MLAMKFQKMRKNFNKAIVYDEMTGIPVISFHVSDARYYTIRSYITENIFRFGSIFVEQDNAHSSFNILFFNDEKYIQICEYDIISRENIHKYCVNYDKIFFLEK